MRPVSRRWLLASTSAVSLAMVAAGRAFGRLLAGKGIPVQTITGVSPTSLSVAGGTGSAGRAIGTVAVLASPRPFNGTLALSGGSASSFAVTSKTGVLSVGGRGIAVGNYHLNVVPTQPGAVGTDTAVPITVAVTAVARQALTAEITFDNVPGKTLIFDSAMGANLGDYVASVAGFTQRCVRVRNAALPSFLVDFRPDASGGRVEVVFWNSEAAGTIPSGYARDLTAYTAVVKSSGVTIHSEHVPFHYWGQRWRWQSAPRPLIRTRAQVFNDGFLPHMSTSAARITGYSGIIVPPRPPAVGTYTTFMAIDNPVAVTKLGLNANVDTGGERPEIGLITEWQADYLLNGTPSSLSAMRNQAEMCAGDWNMFTPDQVTNGPVDYKSDDAHYRLNTYQQSNYSSPPWKQMAWGSANGWNIHEADSHIPNIFYVPFALTEDPYLLEAMQYVVQYGTGWTVYSRDVVFPPYGTRVVCSYPGENRSLGWGIRNLAVAYKCAPSSPPSWLLPNSYYASLSQDYATIIDARYTRGALPQYKVFRWLSDDNYWQVFEHSYSISAMALADLVDLPATPSWNTALAYYFYMIDQLTSGTSGWNRQCPQPHDVLTADLNNLSPPSWGAAWAHWKSYFQTGTFPNAPSPGNQQGGSMGNCSQIYAACACAKSRGIAAAGGAKNWMDTFINFNYPKNADASMGIAFYMKCGFDGT